MTHIAFTSSLFFTIPVALLQNSTLVGLQQYLFADKFAYINKHRAMLHKHHSEIVPGLPMLYQIRLKGHLNCQWTDWFAGLVITLEDNGDTLLTGPVADQAALFGLLRKVRDLGMPLLEVIYVGQEQEEVTEKN